MARPLHISTARYSRSGGDIPRALSALERAVVLHDGGLTFTKVDPMLDPIRNEPRFKAVLAGLKFPD